jgi:short-subunit dehydrogenase
MAELAGKRALITGGSGGIGAAIARLLARRGIALVLTARRKDALDQVAAECRALGAQVDVIVCDLGVPETAHTLWQAATAGGPIDICVNNAGFGYFRPFTEIEWARDAEMLQLNITSLVELSLLFARARRAEPGRAYLLNIASIAAYQAVPNMAVYAASKAFVRNFTEALHDELRATPVSATCVCPGGTITDFHATAGAGDYSWIANRSMMSAERCAEISVRAMAAGKRTVVTGLVNKLSCFGVRLVPRRFASWMANRVMGKPRPGELPARTTSTERAA